MKALLTGCNVGGNGRTIAFGSSPRSSTRPVLAASRVRGGSGSRSAQLQGRLLEAGRNATGCQAKLDRERWSTGAGRCRPVGGSHVPELRYVHATLEAQVACGPRVTGR